MESLGFHSVKSLYSFLQQEREGDVPVLSTGFWNKLWKIRVPPKVKDFIWRASSNCLPTTTLLRTKHVNVSDCCLLCKLDRETTFHCLVECQFAKLCWLHTGIDTSNVQMVTFPGWLDSMLHKIDGEQKKVLIMTCWALWRIRNDVIWNNKIPTVAGVSILAQYCLEQWEKAQDKHLVPRVAFLIDADAAEKWCKPAVGFLKINVDATLFATSNVHSFVCVARDSTDAVKLKP
uniref:Reverse transcriptase zinc-binding domain-containing protein n=1 Tax=Cannabis sativa TaxID=3483 RepID=A0A803PWE1_CANSA